MHFIGIGAQRAGTTWLWRLLQSHPSVAFSPVKELHYFSCKHLRELGRDYREGARRQLLTLLGNPTGGAVVGRDALRIRLLSHLLTLNDDEDYIEYFEKVAAYSGKSCTGEITPLYGGLSRDGFANIRELYPAVRIFLVMRNPADRIWSNAHMDEKPHRDLLRFAASMPVRLRTDFERTLTELLEVIERDQVHVAFYEELSDPTCGGQHLASLFEFLDLPLDAIPRPKAAAGRRRPPRIDPELRQQLVRQYRHVYEFARSFMGYLPASWEQDLLHDGTR